MRPCRCPWERNQRADGLAGAGEEQGGEWSGIRRAEIDRHWQMGRRRGPAGGSRDEGKGGMQKRTLRGASVQDGIF